MDYVSGFLEFISRGRRTAFIVGAAAWLFLALRQDVTSIISIPDFRMGVWLIAYGASAIFFFGILYDFAAWSFNRVKESLGKRRSLAQEKKELLRKQAELHDLSFEEKSVLRPFIENKTKSYLLDEDSIAILLGEKDILYRLDTGYLTGHRQRLIPRQKNYYISDWAYKYLVKNPHLIL